MKDNMRKHTNNIIDNFIYPNLYIFTEEIIQRIEILSNNNI